MNIGFFTEEDLEGAARIKKRKSKHAGCGACKLNKKCRSPKMQPSGEGKKKMYILAEAPGEKEDRRNEPLLGKEGQLVRRVVREKGMDLDEDFIKSYALCCRPPEDKIKDSTQIGHCRPNVLQALEEARPKVVILLGYYALQSYFGDRTKILGKSLSKWRGYTIPDFENDCWVVPTFDPEYVLNVQKDNPMVKFFFKKDIANAIQIRNYDVPVYTPQINIVNKINAIRKMNKIKNFSWFSFDFEATGLKPDAPGHRIICCSITTETETFAFMLDDEGVKQRFMELLRNDKIGKIAANMSFEERWCRKLLNTPVACWIWDTMLAGHVLDNREGVVGLKFQALVSHGVMEYNDEVSSYISSGQKNANAFNSMHLVRKKDILFYCGMDSELEYNIAMTQMRRMGILDPLQIIKKKRGGSWEQW